MKLLASRTAQYPMSAEFGFQHNNWVVDSADGAKKTLGSTVALSTDPAEASLNGPVANTVTFDCIPLPPGAVIIGGEVIVETAYAGSTAATLSLGIAGTLTGLLNAVDLKTAGRTALTLTSPLLANAGQNLRATIAYTVANATAGKVRVSVQYRIDGRTSEVQVA
ncbi:MAG TPA: hypothetical protein PK861_00045 [Thermomonas sp.]|nr:hypothetical protein [Thermomonas sp.]